MISLESLLKFVGNKFRETSSRLREVPAPHCCHSCLSIFSSVGCATSLTQGFAFQWIALSVSHSGFCISVDCVFSFTQGFAYQWIAFSLSLRVLGLHGLYVSRFTHAMENHEGYFERPGELRHAAWNHINMSFEISILCESGLI